jgi:hypothetical protein
MPYYVKAVFAGGVAFLGTLGVAIAEAGVSGPEMVAIALATLLAVGGILGLQAAPATVSTSIKG